MEDENIMNESVESPEVAETETEALDESAETQEVAEPAQSEDSQVDYQQTGRTEQDSAFAEMRRQNQQLAHEKDMLMQAMSRYFDGETPEELFINANAYAEERNPDEYREEWEHYQEFDRLQAENADLQDKLMNLEVDRLMREGLREVQEIDPNVKSLDELGEDFAQFIASGLSTKQAYYATKSMEVNEKTFPPDPIGRIADNRAERDYYTSEELDNLSDEEMEANWDKVMRSMSRLKPKT